MGECCWKQWRLYCWLMFVHLCWKINLLLNPTTKTCRTYAPTGCMRNNFPIIRCYWLFIVVKFYPKKSLINCFKRKENFFLPRTFYRQVKFVRSPFNLLVILHKSWIPLVFSLWLQSIQRISRLPLLSWMTSVTTEQWNRKFFSPSVLYFELEIFNDSNTLINASAK